MLRRIAIFCVLAGFCLGDEFPGFLNVCHRDNPDLDQCMRSSVEDLRPYLVSGVPEYRIPSIEPLIIHDLISEEVAGMKIVTSNVSAYGCSDYFARKINVNLDTMKFSLDVDIPKLKILAHYTVDGKFVLVPVKGSGDLEANVTDVMAKVTLDSELYEKDGETYLRFLTCKLKCKVQGGGLRLENMFNGDKTLLGMFNDAVNKNLDAFLKELMPVIEKGLGATFLEISNNIVEKFTYKQLFPH